MIDVGTNAPDFTLTDQFGREFSLQHQRDRHFVMLAFYPLDFTPT